MGKIEEMKICDYRGTALHQPQSGGKAGKGRNKTSTIQVRDDFGIVKQFRYDVDSFQALKSAVAKAKLYVDRTLNP